MCLTTGQVAELLFVDTRGTDGQIRSDHAAHRAARRALERLWEGELLARHKVNLVARRKLQAYPSYVNVLTAKGATVLREHYEQIDSQAVVQWTPQVFDLLNHHLEHRVAIYDFYALAVRACRRSGIQLRAWWDDRQLTAHTRQGDIHFHSIPDAVMVLMVNTRVGLTFVEIDRGRETIAAVTAGRRDWRAKVEGYLRYLREVYPTETFFRGLQEPTILTVTTTQARLLNLLEATRSAGGDDRFWFTTLDALDPLPDASGETEPPTYERFWHPLWTAAQSGQPRSLRHLLA